MARWSLSVYFVGDQELGGGDEVIKNILFFVQHAGAVPFFAELGAAAQVGDRENSAMSSQR